MAQLHTVVLLDSVATSRSSNPSMANEALSSQVSIIKGQDMQTAVPSSSPARLMHNVSLSRQISCIPSSTRSSGLG